MVYECPLSASLTSLLIHFNWTNVALFSTGIRTTGVSDAVQSAFSKRGIHILHQRTLDDICYPGWYFDENEFVGWVKEIKSEARIFVIIGPNDCHLTLLEAMHQQNLFETNEYFVIGVNTEDFSFEGKINGYLFHTII